MHGQQNIKILETMSTMVGR